MDDNELKIPGMICKSASISAGEVTDRQLAKINKYTLEPLTAEQVFAFKAVLCDNMVDRDFEKFSDKALDDLRKLFVGKTVIKDHRHTADSQIARIFDTELEDSGEMLPDGEAYKQLVAHCYMVRTESNKDSMPCMPPMKRIISPGRHSPADSSAIGATTSWGIQYPPRMLTASRARQL